MYEERATKCWMRVCLMTTHRYSKCEQATPLTSCMHSECQRQKHCQDPLSLRPPERQKCSVYVQQHCADSPCQDIEESWLPCAVHETRTTRKGNHFSHTTATDFVWLCVHTCQDKVTNLSSPRGVAGAEIPRTSFRKVYGVHMQFLERRHGTLGALSDWLCETRRKT